MTETENSRKQMSWKAVIILAISVAALVIAGVAILTAKLRGNGGPISTDYIKVPVYKGVEIEMDLKDITDEDVNQRIQGELESNKINNEITDRPCQDGDYVNVSYTGSIDEEAIDDLSENNVEICLDKSLGMFSDEFIDGIMGHSLKDEFDIPVSYPEDYEMEDVRGKTVYFHFVINEIYTKTVPELTDDYVKENVEGCKTVEEYKAKISEELKSDLENNTKKSREDLAWEEVMNQSSVVKYPKGRVKEEVNKFNETYKSYADQYGISFEDFLSQYLGTDQDGFDKEVKEAAKDTVKTELIVNAIAKKEGLELSKAEYEKRLGELASDYGYDSADEFVEAYKDQLDEDELKTFILTEKVKEWVGENAVVTKASQEDQESVTDETETTTEGN